MNPLLSVPPVIQSHYRAIPRPSPEQWGLAVGAWGDVICCYGNFRQFVGQGGIIYHGTDPSIVDFLSRQQGVHEVRWVKADSTEELNKTVRALTAYPMDRSWAGLPELAGVELSAVTPTHLEYSEAVKRPIFRWHGAKLGSRAYHSNWVFDQSQRYVLFQPYSLRLQEAEDHWPEWEFALDFLLNFTPYHVVVVGQGWELEGEHPRLTNLIGCTSNMEEVFALAERADAIVTTSNALGVYAAIQGLPCLQCANKHFTPPNFFHRFCSVDSMSIVEHYEGRDVFVARFAERYRL